MLSGLAGGKSDLLDQRSVEKHRLLTFRFCWTISSMDVLTPDRRSAVMRSVRSENTLPELEVRKLAHALGYRFRLHRKDLPGRPDLVFPRIKSVIFVHGCFWHQHDCPAAARPTSRSDYWNSKLDGNIVRDKKNILLLRSLGWRILVIWECQIKNRSQLTSRLMRFLRRGE